MRGRQSRVAHLDGIRGIAILTVFAVHWVGPRFPGFEGGYVGVDLFFVLSGFIITALLVRRRPSYGSFMRDRFRRLYPPLLGALVGGIVLAAVWPGSALSPVESVKHAVVAIVQVSSFWDAADVTPLDPFSVTWSLSVEWYFYALWPLAVVHLRRLPRKRAAMCSLTAAAVCYAAALPLSGWWFYYGPVARFSALLVGAALAFWLDPHGERRRLRVPSVAVLAVFAFVAAWTAGGTSPYSLAYRFCALPLTILGACVLIVAGYETHPGWPLRLLRLRPLVFVGLVSYTLYLWHTIPLALLPGDWLGMPRMVTAAVGLSLVVVCTGIAYRLLEVPFRGSRGSELQQPSVEPEPSRQA